ncbi:MAG: hypothetical protein KDD82_29595 [Planctomycetes bacterium]|nr:hypothetical protein [Planctomycetota bacterium]
MHDVTARPAAPLPWSLLLTVWLAGLSVRLAAAARCGSLNPDGVVDLDQARAWAAGDVSGALAPGFSPLLSVLAASLHRLFATPLEGSALAVVVLGSSLAAPASAAAAGWIWPQAARRAAFAAGLLAAVHPYLVRLGGQIMGYGLSQGLLAVGAALTVRALLEPRARVAALAGATLGLAFLARTDALTGAAGLACALACGSRRRPAQLGAFACAGLLVTGPYLLALRVHHGEWRLSGRKTVTELVDPTPIATAALPGETLGGLAAAEAVTEAGTPVPPDWIGGWVEVTTYASGKLIAAVVPPLFGLALLGALVAAARPRGPPAHLWGLLTFLAGQILLRANFGYTGRIHASSAAVLAAPLAAVGWTWIPWRRLGGRHARLLAAGTLALGLLALLPKALKPQQAGRAPQAQVGAWVRAEFGDAADPVWGLDSRVVAYYAGATYRDTPSLTPAELVRQGRAAGARAFVVAVRHRGPRPEALEAALARAGAERVDPGFESEVEKTTYRWLVFRLPR